MFPVIRRYASYYAATGVQQSTAAQCAEKLDRIFRTLSTDYGVIMHEDFIENLTPQILTDYYISLADANRKMSTRNNYVCFLNPFLRWAYQNEIVSKDLSSILSPHKLPSPQSIPENERVQKRLTHEQARALIESANGCNRLRDRAIIALFLHSGLRVSELCSLTIGSVINQPAGTIYLKRKGGNWCHACVGKEVYPYLEDYLCTRADRRDMSAPLFVTTHGSPCDRKIIYDMLSKKQRKLGLATGPHALRHTFISEVNSLGGASVARDLANHSSLAITNRYSHVTKDELRCTVDALSW